MIACEYFTFSAPPKSGCRWMHAVVRRLGEVSLPGFPDNHVHHPARVDDRPPLSFVRHPADWIRSYYQNITSDVGHGPVDRFVNLTDPQVRRQHPCDQNHLRAFVEAYLDGPAGTIAAMFESYPADQRWKVEEMPDPLDWFLRQKGAVRLGDIFAVDRHETKEKIELPDDLREAVREHEAEFCDKWGYA